MLSAAKWSAKSGRLAPQPRSFFSNLALCAGERRKWFARAAGQPTRRRQPLVCFGADAAAAQQLPNLMTTELDYASDKLTNS